MEEFIGGMNIPGRFARANLTAPLAKLIFDEQSLRFTARMGRWLIGPNSSALYTDMRIAYPLSGSAMLGAGVGIDLSNGSRYFFWTTKHTSAVLEALAARGVAIDPEPRSAQRAVWGLG